MTSQTPHRFDLGMTLRCTVTGFQGVAIARVEHLNGCVQYCVKPTIDKDKPHERGDGYYIDEEMLDYVDNEWNLEQAARKENTSHNVAAARPGGASHREGELPR